MIVNSFLSSNDGYPVIIIAICHGGFGDWFLGLDLSRCGVRRIYEMVSSPLIYVAVVLFAADPAK